MSVEDGDGNGDSANVSIPRGGPIYVPHMVGPLTRVPDFQASLLHELENLQTELWSDSSDTCFEDLSVDELKIMTEEDLVNKAFEEAFKESEVTVNSSLGLEEHSDARGDDDDRTLSKKNSCLETSYRGQDASTSHCHPPITAKKGHLSENVEKKRKRKECAKRTINSGDDSYIAKVEQLARVKKQQDEYKAAARLHSFNGTNKCTIICSEKIERMTSLKSTSCTGKVRPSNTHAHVPVVHPEVVLCVEVYHNKRAWLKTKEFLVLGIQTLTELRDKINCSSDEIMKKAGHSDPSGYFLIENVFYNDLRDPSAIDYSRPIFDWLKNSKEEALEKWECIISGELLRKQKELLGGAVMPQFRAGDMHKSRFCDLRFRLGAGYLYCHQGDCKHMIVIRDMRMMHTEDVQNRAAYPLIAFQMKERVHKCSVCKIYRAEKVTVDDKWAGQRIHAISVMFVITCFTMLISLYSTMTSLPMIIFMNNFNL